MSEIQITSSLFQGRYGDRSDDQFTGLSLIFNGEGIGSLKSVEQKDLSRLFLATVCQALCKCYRGDCGGIITGQIAELVYEDSEKNPNAIEFEAAVTEGFNFDNEPPCKATQINYGELTA